MFSYIHASMPQDFLGQHGSTRHCATVISPSSLTFSRSQDQSPNRQSPAGAGARAGAAGNAWKRVIVIERQRETDLYISYRILSYLIVPCHIFIPLHTQTGVKFEIGNITDLFWEQRPRLGCAGALFFKFENKYILMHVPNLQVPLGSHLTHPHTHRHRHRHTHTRMH